MPILVIKNKRSQLLYRRLPFSRRLVRIVTRLTGLLTVRSKYQATIRSQTTLRGSIQPKMNLRATIRVCDN